MEKNVGLWIDHEKTFIISIINGKEEMKKIESNVESHIRSLGGSRSPTPYGPQDVSAERKLERKRKQHLRQYYQNIISEIKNVQSIYIFGPGEAKIELEKEIRKSKEFATKTMTVESADKMTEAQMMAKVKKFFGTKK